MKEWKNEDIYREQHPYLDARLSVLSNDLHRRRSRAWNGWRSRGKLNPQRRGCSESESRNESENMQTSGISELFWMKMSTAKKWLTQFWQWKNKWVSNGSEKSEHEHYIENESESDRWESGQLKWRNGFLKYRRWFESEMEKMESESEKVKLENTVEWNAYGISCWTVFQLKAYFLSFWKVYSTSSL